jgi:hypothetical protein
MHILLSVLQAATPSPSGTPDPSATFYSPGTIGFIMTFFVTAGAVALIFDMVRRIRRGRGCGQTGSQGGSESCFKAGSQAGSQG